MGRKGNLSVHSELQQQINLMKIITVIYSLLIPLFFSSSSEKCKGIFLISI
jgi:hypothetical protein